MRLPAFVLAALLSSSTLAAVHDDALGIDFPDQIGGLTFEKRFEFPHKDEGVNIRYVGDGPVIGSIYIYNPGLSQIPSGIDSTVVRHHFEQIIAAVKHMETVGKAREIDLTAGQKETTSYAGCGPQFIRRGYVMDLDGQRLSSFSYLTGVKNQFVKLRITYRPDDREAPARAERFVEALRKIVGECK